MIRYALSCDHDHEFEGWFGSSSDYDDQQARGLIECPMCASTKVRKQIMAPSVVGAKKNAASEMNPTMRSMVMEAMGKVRRHVEENFDYVGDAFAKEARDIHEGKAEDRGIYGEASPQQIRDLTRDGVQVAALPPPPPKKTDVN